MISMIVKCDRCGMYKEVRTEPTLTRTFTPIVPKDWVEITYGKTDIKSNPILLCPWCKKSMDSWFTKGEDSYVDAMIQTKEIIKDLTEENAKCWKECIDFIEAYACMVEEKKREELKKNDSK